MLEGSYYPNAQERKEMKKQLKVSVVPAWDLLVLSAGVARCFGKATRKSETGR